MAIRLLVRLSCMSVYPVRAPNAETKKRKIHNCRERSRTNFTVKSQRCCTLKKLKRNGPSTWRLRRRAAQMPTANKVFDISRRTFFRVKI